MNNKVKHNQTGMVSILVTMIMMIVISLIVIGFSQVTRHNQREALDQQLSTQAYYAAESGVNYAQKAIQTAIAASSPIPGSNTCSGFTGFAGASSLNSANNTEFTCLLVNPTPPSLKQTPLNLNSNVVWHIASADGGNFTVLSFKWAKDANVSASGPSYCTAPVSSFPSVDKWQSSAAGGNHCNFPMLRVDLVQDPSSTTGAASLAQKTITLFLKPAGTNSVPTLPSNFAASSQKAYIIPCNVNPGDTTCKVTVNVSGSNSYYARLSTLYGNSDAIEVTGDELSGTGVPLKDGQAIIDVTGKAQDELRRIQVRIPLTQQPGGTRLPNFGAQLTGSICKLLTVGPGVYEDGSTTNPDCN